MRIQLVVAFLFILLLVNILTIYSTSDYGWEVKDIYDGTYLTVYYVEEDLVVGVISIKPILSEGIERITYDYLLKIDFVLENITKLWSSNVIDMYFKVMYNFSSSDAFLDGSWIIDNDIELTLSSFIDGFKDLSNVSIESLTITLTIYSLERSATIPADVKSLLVKYNLSTNIIVNLDLYQVELNSIYRDPGWLDLELYSSHGKLGLIRISASGQFNFTRSLRIYFNLLNQDYKELMDITLFLELYVDGKREIIDYNLMEKNEIILPKDFIDYVEFSNITITQMLFKIKMPYTLRSFDIVNLTGYIYLIGGRGVNIYDLEVKLESFKELGNGWILITLGVYEDIAIDNLKISFMPLEPSMRPIIQKAFVKEMEGKPNYLINLMLLFRESGILDGYITVDLSTQDFIKREEIRFNALISEGGNVDEEEINLEYTIAYINGGYIIEIELNDTVSFWDQILIEVEIECYKEGFNDVDIVYDFETSPKASGSSDYKVLRNSTSSGKVEVRFRGSESIIIKLYPQPELSELCGGGLFRGETSLKKIVLYVDGVDTLKVSRLHGMIYTSSPPDEVPPLCNLPEDGWSPYPLIINIFLPGLAILAAGIISIMVYLRERNKETI